MYVSVKCSRNCWSALCLHAWHWQTCKVRQYAVEATGTSGAFGLASFAGMRDQTPDQDTHKVSGSVAAASKRPD